MDRCFLRHRPLPAHSSVKETNVIVRDYDPTTGNKVLNQYMILRELGRGSHGKVKLCIDTETGEKWASWHALESLEIEIFSPFLPSF
jgi:serine/threonine protein kinase